ncbi:MAG TPA: hypothetical protein VFZ70_01545 [Euzebyales bacterium]
MSAIVVLLVAVAVVLVFAVAVAVMRLVTALRRFGDAVQSTQRWLEPVLAELNEGGQVASLEAAQLQASIADLRGTRFHETRGGPAAPDTKRRSGGRRPGDASGYTA